MIKFEKPTKEVRKKMKRDVLRQRTEEARQDLAEVGLENEASVLTGPSIRVLAAALNAALTDECEPFGVGEQAVKSFTAQVVGAIRVAIDEAAEEATGGRGMISPRLLSGKLRNFSLECDTARLRSITAGIADTLFAASPRPQ
jgi:hypothetical protein